MEYVLIDEWFYLFVLRADGTVTVITNSNFSVEKEGGTLSNLENRLVKRKPTYYVFSSRAIVRLTNIPTLAHVAVSLHGDVNDLPNTVLACISVR